jgi:hypothetical protein
MSAEGTTSLTELTAHHEQGTARLLGMMEVFPLRIHPHSASCIRMTLRCIAQLHSLNGFSPRISKFTIVRVRSNEHSSHSLVSSELGQSSLSEI